MVPKRSRVLIVCEGNICRSPLSALLLQSMLEDHLGIDVASAGLRAVVGAGMDELASEQAERYSLDPADHIARRLTEDMLQSAVLVLTMTVDQRTRVVQLNPLAMRRTFTLKEFASLATMSPNAATRGVELLRSVAHAGDLSRASRRNDDMDIEDPYRRDKSVHARVATEIFEATHRIAARLNG